MNRPKKKPKRSSRLVYVSECCMYTDGWLELEPVPQVGRPACGKLFKESLYGEKTWAWPQASRGGCEMLGTRVGTRPDRLESFSPSDTTWDVTSR